MTWNGWNLAGPTSSWHGNSFLLGACAGVIVVTLVAAGSVPYDDHDLMKPAWIKSKIW